MAVEPENRNHLDSACAGMQVNRHTQRPAGGYLPSRIVGWI